MENMESSTERLGVVVQYTETPVILKIQLIQSVNFFKSILQYKQGPANDLVTVSIMNRQELKDVFRDIFQYGMFDTDMSVKQPFIDHLSKALASELSRSLGLNALASKVLIPADTSFFTNLSEHLITNFETPTFMRQYLFEQILQQSPERFGPGKDDTYLPIPFEAGDSISFFLTLLFDTAVINSDVSMPLRDFLENEEMPVVKFVVRFSFSS